MKEPLPIGMILAAGRGVRMRELCQNKPKPLIEVNGRSLLEHILDKARKYHFKKIVINTCYKGEMIKEKLKSSSDPIFFSDETTALETGGGVKNALPLLLPLGKDGFFILNGDSFWEEPHHKLLDQMGDFWDPEQMDVLLAVVPLKQAKGSSKEGDFFIENGRLRRKKPMEKNVPYVYIGVQIVHPRVFDNISDNSFSMRQIFDSAQENKRLFHLVFDGNWYHIGDPEALFETEQLFDKKG